MDTNTTQRLTGVSGLLVGTMALLVGPLYFIYSGVPPVWDVLTRNLLNLVICTSLIVFVTGLRHLIRQAGADCDWVASLLHSAGLAYATIVLVGISLETGAVLGAPNGTIDPTTDGPLAYGNILIHGSIGRALTALYLATAGYALLRTKALPSWVGRTAYAIAAVNLAFVPSLYFGKDPAQFYSALGWGNTALTASLVGYWTMAAGIAMLKRPGLAQPR